MHRTETVSVFNPEISDDVFSFTPNSTKLETQLDTSGEYVGMTITGKEITFDFFFPTADTNASTVLQTVLASSDYETGKRGIEKYAVYDTELQSIFTVGVETDSQIVLFVKEGTTPESIRTLYKQVCEPITSPVRVVKTETYHTPKEQPAQS